MDLDAVKAFDLQQWVGDSCHLYLWVTDAYLGRAYEITEIWGFNPKASLVWIKDRIGMGNYYRHQHEVCIFAVKGEMRLKRKDASTIFEAAVTRHSEKPDAFYALVESRSLPRCVRAETSRRLGRLRRRDYSGKSISRE